MNLRRAGGLAAVLVLADCSSLEERPRPLPSPSAMHREKPGVPIFSGPPPARMILDARALGIDPSGAARFLVRAHFADASGAATELLSGGNVDFVPSAGNAQWQTRLRFGGPAAIISTNAEGTIRVRVHADVGPRVPDAQVVLDTRDVPAPRVVVQALGPHSVWAGWFPQVAGDDVTVTRTAPGERLQAKASAARWTVRAPSSGFRDDSVVPGHTYRYEIALPHGKRTPLHVSVPPELRAGSTSALFGKGTWLSFSPSTLDDDGYDKLDPNVLAREARTADLRSIDIRTTYGAFDEITPEDAPVIDRLIDTAAERGIATIAWTVPRSTSFEDLAAEIAAAGHRTAAGHGFAALNVDLERGEYFLGNGASGYAALAKYLDLLRAALGPHYPIAATVEDPYLEHLTNARYPYAPIAARANVMMPMAYWHVVLRPGFTLSDVRAAIAGSFAATLRESRRSIPIDVGVQTSPQNAFGAPAPGEIEAAIGEARALGAIGVTCFDWTGTSPGDRLAIARAPSFSAFPITGRNIGP